MMSRRCWYCRVFDADDVEFPSSSLVTDPGHGVVRFTRTLLTPQPVPYVDARYLLPYLPDVVYFILLGLLSFAWFPASESKFKALRTVIFFGPNMVLGVTSSSMSRGSSVVVSAMDELEYSHRRHQLW